jgi:hypothetical protein
MSDIIISEADFEFLQEAYENEENLDILDMLNTMEYNITAELVEEIIDIHGLDIPETKNISMQFYVQPDEKQRLSRILKNKVHETFGGYFGAIAYSFSIKNYPRYYQERENLVAKRLTLPVYVRDIIVRHTILNASTYQHIKGYSFYTILHTPFEEDIYCPHMDHPTDPPRKILKKDCPICRKELDKNNIYSNCNW